MRLVSGVGGILLVVSGCSSSSSPQSASLSCRIVGTPGSDLSVQGMSTNGMSTNGMSTNGLSTNGLSTNGLAADALGPHGIAAYGLGELGLVPGVAGSSAAQTFAAIFDANPADASMFMDYFARCALTEQQSLHFRDLVWTGVIGLTPGWISSPPTTSERRWVSACLMAHTNALGVHHELRLDGSLPQLAQRDPGDAAYSVLEGAYWGDLFEAGSPLSACGGVAAPLASTGRTCAWPTFDDPGQTECGFAWAGDCSAVCSGDACGGVAEVVQTYLTAADFDPQCLAP